MTSKSQLAALNIARSNQKTEAELEARVRRGTTPEDMAGRQWLEAKDAATALLSIDTTLEALSIQHHRATGILLRMVGVLDRIARSLEQQTENEQ